MVDCEMATILHPSLYLLQCDFTALPIKQWSLFPHPLYLDSLETCFAHKNRMEMTVGQFRVQASRGLAVFCLMSWNPLVAMETAWASLSPHHPS